MNANDRFSGLCDRELVVLSNVRTLPPSTTLTSLSLPARGKCTGKGATKVGVVTLLLFLFDVLRPPGPCTALLWTEVHRVSLDLIECAGGECGRVPARSHFYHIYFRSYWQTKLGKRDKKSYLRAGETPECTRSEAESSLDRIGDASGDGRLFTHGCAVATGTDTKRLLRTL